MNQTPSEEELTAYHEAGHAVAAFMLRFPVKHVSIIATDEYLGHVASRKTHRKPFVPDVEIDARTIELGKRYMVLDLAGPAAELLRMNRRRMPKPASDPEVREAYQYARWLAPNKADWAFLSFMWKQTISLLQPRWPLVRALAGLLLSEKELPGGHVRKLIAKEVGSNRWDLV